VRRLSLLVPLVAALAAGCAGSGVEATPAEAEAALQDRLERRELSVTWVRCVGSGYRYEGERVFRCNVNFGDPHIEAYCAVFLQGELATQFERPELRCARKRDSDGSPIG
jgi:hypothetical protein